MTSNPGPTIGSLLIAPADSGPRANDVLYVFDQDADEAGALFALVLNQPMDTPAQPLAFGLFDRADDCAWWGGPTSDPFALVEVPCKTMPDDSYRPSGDRRQYVTNRRECGFLGAIIDLQRCSA